MVHSEKQGSGLYSLCDSKFVCLFAIYLAFPVLKTGTFQVDGTMTRLTKMAMKTNLMKSRTAETALKAVVVAVQTATKYFDAVTFVSAWTLNWLPYVGHSMAIGSRSWADQD